MHYIDELALKIAAKVDDPTPDAEDMPLYRLYAVLALVKGRDVDAKDVHDAWAAWMADINPDHRSLIPFEELSPEVQAMDDPYVAAIRAVSPVIGGRPRCWARR